MRRRGCKPGAGSGGERSERGSQALLVDYLGFAFSRDMLVRPHVGSRAAQHPSDEENGWNADPDVLPTDYARQETLAANDRVARPK